jgi:26S proteasome regulatory subunit N9
MNVDTVADFLADQRDEAPEELQGLIIDFENLWERKLWHQLTEALVTFFENPASVKQRLPFWRVFITKFADKINQLKLVDLGLMAAKTCKGEQAYHAWCPDWAREACDAD